MRLNFKSVNRILLISISILIIIILYCHALDINIQIQLYGVSEQVEPVVPSFDTFRSGKFQESYAKQFNRNFPFRSYFIKTYNQIIYLVGAPVNGIYRGSNNDLHGREFLNSLFFSENYMSEEFWITYENNIKLINQYLQHKNVMFFYLISTNKAEINAHTLPWNYKILSYFKRNRSYLRKKLSKILKNNQISYLDATEYFHSTSSNIKNPIFYKSGIHWNSYGVISTFNEMFRIINTNQFNISKIDAIFLKTSRYYSTEDIDYLLLSNVWFTFSYNDFYFKTLINKFNQKKLYNIYLMSTSFCDGITDLFFNNDMPFSLLKRLFYNQRMFLLSKREDSISMDSIQSPFNIDRLDFSEIEKFDILLFEHNAAGIPEAHIQFINSFADYIRSNAQYLY